MPNQHDPYRRCEEGCNHDLSQGVLVSELLSRPGPYPDTHPLLRFDRPPRRRPPSAEGFVAMAS